MSLESVRYEALLFSLFVINFLCFLELSRYVVSLQDWDWSQAGVTFLSPSLLAHRIYSGQTWGWWKKNSFFFLRLMAKFYCLRELSLRPGHDTDQIKGSKLQELFCHHKNPENRANKCWELSRNQPYLTLFEPLDLMKMCLKAGLSILMNQNFSLWIKMLLSSVFYHLLLKRSSLIQGGIMILSI